MRYSLLKILLLLPITSLASSTSAVYNGSNSNVIKHKEVASPMSSSEGSAYPIVIHGKKFFHSKTGEQFFIKGIAYQPSKIAGESESLSDHDSKFIDPLAEPRICLRDLPYLVDLGVNTVRVYSINTDKNHDVCFKAFSDAGIYVVVDLSQPDVSVVRESPTWDVTIFDRYRKVVDSLHKYDNVLGFFAGNEVTNDKTNTDASAFVKASIRDIKGYIKSSGYRNIPVGYSTNDDEDIRNNIADYFTCGDVSADFYGINMYEWCGYSSYWTSGYKERTEELIKFPIPVFFSEFGCNLSRPRPFTEVEALYGRFMTGTWSGGIAYMYFEEPNEYGVIQLIDGEVQKLDDYANLKNQYNKASPTGVTLKEYQYELSIGNLPGCPFQTKNWKASDIIPHTPDFNKCKCMESSLQCSLGSQKLDPKELLKLFDYSCAIIDCSPITADGVKGEYGVFSDCTVEQKASYIINDVFKLHGGKKSDCDFNGVAAFREPPVNQLKLKNIHLDSGETCDEFLNLNYEKRIQSESNTLKSNSNSSNDKFGKSNIIENKSSSMKVFYRNIYNPVFYTLLAVVVLVIHA